MSVKTRIAKIRGDKSYLEYYISPRKSVVARAKAMIKMNPKVLKAIVELM